MKRQGDILFTRIDKLPSKAKRLKTDIIVHGESTGHSHRLKSGQIFEKDNNLYLVVEKGGEVVHDEHKTIELEAGIYAVIRQREYLTKDMTRVVVD